MKRFVFAFAAAVATASWASVVIGDWESLMRESRPGLPTKATRSPLTGADAVSMLSGGFSGSTAIAVQTLGDVLPAAVTWRTSLSSDEERMDVCGFTAVDGTENCFAVYGQFGSYVPYYWIVEGLENKSSLDVAAFIKRHSLVGGMSSVVALDEVLAADEVDVLERGRKMAVPYERFYFAFVDDRPGANWAHPCRYVFVSEDMSGFAVLYRNYMPVLFRKGTKDKIPFSPAAGAEASGRKIAMFNKVKARIRNYAQSLERAYAGNGLSYGRGDRGKSYFVLISGGNTPGQNGIRFWCDTAMLYSTLTKKYGVAKDHIAVLMSDGTSPGLDANLAVDERQDTMSVLVDSPRDLDGDGLDDIAGAATRSELALTFSGLKPKLSSSDQLFVFMTSHGGPNGIEGPGNYDCGACLFSEDGGEWVDDDELADWTKDFVCPVAFAIQSCYSGGFVDDICMTDNRAIATACNHYENSYGYYHVGEWNAEDNTGVGKTSACNSWTLPFVAAFRGVYPKALDIAGGYPWEDHADPWQDADADANGDGMVSFAEAAAFALENDQEAQGGIMPEHPQYQSTCDLGDNLFVLKQMTKHSLTRDPNGGTYLGRTAATVLDTALTCGSGDYWYIGVPMRTGHEFAGWFTEKSGGAKVYDAEGRCVAGDYWTAARHYRYVGNLAVYAQWTPRRYDLYRCRNCDGDAPVKADPQLKYGSTVWWTVGVPWREGHTFAGWWTQPSGGTMVHGADGLCIDGNGRPCSAVYRTVDKRYIYAGDLTVYAHWLAKRYVLTRDPNGGTYLGRTSATVLDDALTYGTGDYWSIGVPVRAGHAFAGWFTAPVGGTMVYDENGHSVAGDFWTVARHYRYAGNLAVYARWTVK